MPKANQTKSPAEVLAEALGIQGMNGKPITGEELAFHVDPAEKRIMIPEGMTYNEAYKVLERLEEDAETITSFDRRFLYRPDDGANAAAMVIKERYGMAFGKAAKDPAAMRDITVGVGQRRQVPWGRLEIPVFPGLEVRLCDEHLDKDYGKIFEIHAKGPRKYRAEMEKFFAAIELYLNEHSIYRGKAIIGADDPEFLDLASFRKSEIVFSDTVMHVLGGTVWAPIQYTQQMRDNRIGLKRACLLYGPYGTGKTSAGLITAGIAVENGWTFLSARPGRDKVEDVLRTARLYQPAVVFIEDLDGAASTGENEDVTRLLDAFDGITAKGGELMIVMTTNHIERIHKGMLRPGRLDAVVEIAALDEHGIERLIKAVVTEGKLDPEVDYKLVGKAMEGFYPAFVKASIDRAVTFSIARLDGADNYVIGTDDLVGAAQSLIPQLDVLNLAGEGTKRPALETSMIALVSDAVQDLVVDSEVYPYAIRPRTEDEQAAIDANS